MKLTQKIVIAQSAEIRKFLHNRDKDAVSFITNKYPELIKAMKKTFDVSPIDILDVNFYEGLEERIPKDTN